MGTIFIIGMFGNLCMKSVTILQLEVEDEFEKDVLIDPDIVQIFHHDSRTGTSLPILFHPRLCGLNYAIYPYLAFLLLFSFFLIKKQLLQLLDSQPVPWQWQWQAALPMKARLRSGVIAQSIRGGATKSRSCHFYIPGPDIDHGS